MRFTKMQAYGNDIRPATGEPEKESGIEYSRSIRMPIFYGLILFAFLMNATATLNIFIPAYMQDIQFSVEQSSFVASSAMIGVTIGKILLGMINDRDTRLGVLTMTLCGIGGLLGSGSAAGTALGVIAEKDAKIAQLTAERYSDNQDAATYRQTLADNRTLREELYAFIKPLAEESASNRERVAVLEAKCQCEAEKAALREQIFQQKIDLEAAERRCCCEKNAAAIGALSAIVAQITKIGVPNEALCPGVPPVTVQHTTTPAA